MRAETRVRHIASHGSLGKDCTWITGKGWSMLVLPEDGCLKQLPDLSASEAKWLFHRLLDKWNCAPPSSFSCCSALRESIETSDPAGGDASYRETGTAEWWDCAGQWSCSSSEALLENLIPVKCVTHCRADWQGALNHVRAHLPLFNRYGPLSCQIFWFFSDKCQSLVIWGLVCCSPCSLYIGFLQAFLVSAQAISIDYT